MIQMRFAFIDDFVPALVVGDRVIEVADLLDSIPRLRPQDWFTGLLDRLDEFRGPLEAAARDREGRPMESRLSNSSGSGR